MSERSGFAGLGGRGRARARRLVLGLEVSRDRAQQRRLVPAARSLRRDRHGDRRRRRAVSPRVVQRPPPARAQRHDVGGEELHVLRTRLEGGIRNKAARGELRKALPSGWGGARRRPRPARARRGGARRDRDDLRSVRGARSVRRVRLWMRRGGVRFPMRRFAHGEIQWRSRTYHQVHSVLESRVYAGRTRSEDAPGALRRRARNTRQRMRRLHRRYRQVSIWDHHRLHRRRHVRGERQQIGRNTRPRAHQAEGAVREGRALLQVSRYAVVVDGS